MRMCGSNPRAAEQRLCSDAARLSALATLLLTPWGDAPSQVLDVLVNNAGVSAIPERETTADGLERIFQVTCTCTCICT